MKNGWWMFCLTGFLLFIGLIFVPILIWSPPWGVDGYYTLINSRFPQVFFCLKDDNLYYSQLGGSDRDPTIQVEKFNYLKPNEWMSRDGDQHLLANGKFLGIFSKNRKPFYFQKQCSFFNIWWIKYHEWVNREE